MKFTLPIVALASTFAACVGAASTPVSNVTLSVDTENPAITDKGLSDIHEGAALDFVFLGKDSAFYSFDRQKKSIYKTVKIDEGKETVYWDLGLGQNVLTIGGAVEKAEFSAEQNDYLALNGSTEGFYAQKNLSYDPYGYSKKQYALTYYGKDSAPEGSIPVKVKLNYVAVA